MTLKRTLSRLIIGKRGSQNRIRIIELLAERPYNLNQLAELLEVNYRTVKHHVETLEKHGLLVASTPKGYGEVYFLSKDMTDGLPFLREMTKKINEIEASPIMLKNLVEQSHDAVMVVDVDGNALFLNESAERLFGVQEEETMGRPLTVFKEEGLLEGAIKRAAEGEAVVDLETKGPSVTGRDMALVVNIHSIKGKDDAIIGYSIVSRDITEKKEEERRRRLMTRVLATLNRSDERLDVVKEILTLVKASLGLEAVGIRLKEGDEYPYYEANGFPSHFVEDGMYICAKDEKGNIVRDENGRPALECMCGIVIRGRTDPTVPFFTENGSFWTNCTTDLLASTTENQSRWWKGSRCHLEEYESVALIPLRSDTETIGILQLNDRRRGMFTVDLINFFEGLGSSIGIAIQRRKALEELRLGEERYKLAQRVARFGSWDWDIRTGSLHWSDSIEPMFGFRPGEFGRTYEAFLACVHPEDRKHVIDSVDACVKDGKDYDIEHRIVWPDGTVRWVSETGDVIRDGKGVAVRMLGVVIDITERRRDKTGE